jgi:hypothetical protein
MNKNIKIFFLVYSCLVQYQLFQNGVIYGVLADENIKDKYGFGVLGCAILFIATLFFQIIVILSILQNSKPK